MMLKKREEARQRLALVKAAHEGRKILCNACSCFDIKGKLYIGVALAVVPGGCIKEVPAIFHEGNVIALLTLKNWRWKWNKFGTHDASSIYSSIKIL